LGHWLPAVISTELGTTAPHMAQRNSSWKPGICIRRGTSRDDPRGPRSCGAGLGF
jgi:hypothetical protein